MRLIDADALLTELHQYDDDSAFKDEFEYGLQQRLDTCIYAVEDAPTVDAVPVVRCRDCRHWSKYPGSSAAPRYHECMARMTHMGNLYTTADEFCSRGERKDGESE